MAEIIQMPKLSDTMEEGVIATWLKKEGDFVEEGEALAEIETDKATMEYNSPEEGYLLKILLPAGQPCALNAPVAVLGEKGESFDESSLVSEQEKPKPVEPTKEPEVTPPAPVVVASDSKRIKASPLAKKLAKEKDLDLSLLKGSGPNGRIVVRDIESSKPIVTTPTVASEYEDINNSTMRRTIAKRLLAGKNEAPHFYLTISVNMGKLISWRKELNSEQDAVKVSVNDLIVLACSRALVKHPQVNSSWHGDFIRRYHNADISMAVAIDDGLITPIIKQANKLGLREIAAKSKELVSLAKSSSLQPEQYQGGSFSISNLGMMGIEEFTAIINPPQAAILAVGATIATPAVDTTGEIVVEQRMKLTMSCDHRVIDGASGAEFLKTLKRYLEQPLSMLT